MFDSHIKLRIRILLILFALIAIALAIRIIYLVNIPAADYIIREGKYSIKRGDIVDSHYRILAVSDEMISLYANPYEIKKKEQTALELSTLLNLSYQEISSKLESDKNFVWIKRKIPLHYQKLIKEKKLTGIYITKEYQRFYPNRKLASHILGFCDIDNRGVEGVENIFNPYLFPEEPLSDLQLEDKKNGLNVQLTIDSTIQAFSENILAKMVQQEHAESASIILMDGLNGEILAMANYPDFDPNLYQNSSQKYFRNTAIFNQYEPGSVIKIMTIASLLDMQMINEQSVFHCDGFFNGDDNRVVQCTGIHGDIDIAGIFKYSCNDATLQAASLIQPANLYQSLKQFGFGEITAIRLPGEQSGILRPIDQWTSHSMLSIPIGQEISVNSLQMVQAATTFVHDGIMIKPIIIKSIFDNNQKVIQSYQSHQIRRVFKSGIAQNILHAMTFSTTSDGTVSDLSVNGIRFSAKSGTGEIFDPELGDYSPDQFSSSLLLIFPYENPRYIAYVVFHKPGGEIKWGGVIGADFFNHFLSSLTGYLDVKPPIAEIESQNIYINREYQKINKLPSVMPDLTGLSAGDILDIFSLVKLPVLIKGKGTAYEQTPSPGTMLTEDTQIMVQLKDQ
ncbi:MAG: transpeptidase family protein [Spirochaetes bacterium]|nr:transpeptidase family protein [Spirochaetota bacterium]